MADHPLVKRCQSFLDMSQTLMNKENIETRIAHTARAYSYNWRKDDVRFWTHKDSLVHVNMVNPIVRTSVASLYAKRPDIIVKPRLAQYQENAGKSELFLNYAARRQDHSREISLALNSACLFPYGVVKLGVGEEGMPTITYSHPLSFRGDPTRETFEPEFGRWCAFKYKRSLSAMRASGLYDEALLDKLAATYMKEQGSGFSEETTPVWLWENYLYEKVEGKKKLLICTLPHQADFLIREEPFSDVAGLPCRTLQFVPSFDAHFPISPVELFLDLQRELDAIRSNQLIHSDRAQRKIIVREDAFDNEELTRGMESTESMTVIKTNAQDARTAAAMLEQANMSADIYQVENRIVSDIQRISAIGDINLGANPNVGSRSATEASIMENSMRLRSSDRQDIFERFLESVYHGYLKLAQERMSTTLQLKIMADQWVPVSKQDLEGEFDLEISVGSTMPTDRKSEYDKALQLYQTLQGNPLINPLKPLTYLLQKQGDIKDVTGWIASPPPLPPPVPGGAPGAPPGMGGPPPPGGMPPDPNAAANGQAEAGFHSGQSPLSIAALLRHTMGPPHA